MTFSQRIGRGIQSDHGWDAGKAAGWTSNSNPIAGLEESLQDHDFRLHLVKKRGNYGKQPTGGTDCSKCGIARRRTVTACPHELLELSRLLERLEPLERLELL